MGHCAFVNCGSARRLRTSSSRVTGQLLSTSELLQRARFTLPTAGRL